MNTGSSSLAVQDSFVPVLDATLRVRFYTHGHPKDESRDPVIVFLHEGLGCVEMWKDFPEQVCAATGLNGMAYDRKGYGQSSRFTAPRQPDYLHIEGHTYLPALLESLGIEKSILIGHSDGGTIALLYAGAYPRAVNCLMTLAAHVFVEKETVQGIREARNHYQASDWPQKLAKYHGDKTEAVFYAWTDTWLSEEFATWNIEQDLQGIHSPVLVMQGVDDIYGTHKQVDSIIHNTKGPAWAHWVPECGHVPHIEAKGHVLQAVQDFIARHGHQPVDG